MVLNFKKIDYETDWVEYPDLAPRWKALGIPPNDKNDPGYFADYSSPVIRYADGSYQMDSWLIAHALEKQYPTPSLHLDDPVVLQIRDHVAAMTKPLVPLAISQVPVVLLNKPSADFFYETREKAFGKPLEQVRSEADEEKCWEEAAAAAKVTGDLLRKNGGPFFLGETGKLARFVYAE